MTTAPGGEPPFLTLHTAVVLFGSLFIGLVAGGLTFLGGSGAALSVLGGLTAAGVSVPVLRGLIR
ncbi:hypothetical protein DEJ50_30455 [Streptomyces venezuelae]|uniref:Uncharacterized protein n=1 Tax=Streptomyces venezuelae TaxID=54571 RepID=A0A5P2DBD5_STRVZ|nr:hypothetical protein [Streptomyces venezuelae]QES51527.1 hypothetical protein DEJ50_30455 [Streptomyces venezuelae]